jgi:dTMP kinase
MTRPEDRTDVKKTIPGGLFVTFEGGERSGKTTLAHDTTVWLQGLGYQVRQTREPGGTDTGRDIRAILLDPGTGLDYKAEALLFAADRAQHVATVIRPAMASGAIVLCDRFGDSSVAYQGVARGLGVSRIRELSKWAAGDLAPNLTVLLDIIPEDALARRGLGRVDRIEQEDAWFHDMVRRAFLELARIDEDRYLTIDATLPVEDIAGLVRKRILTEIEQIAS